MFSTKLTSTLIIQGVIFNQKTNFFFLYELIPRLQTTFFYHPVNFTYPQHTPALAQTNTSKAGAN